MTTWTCGKTEQLSEALNLLPLRAVKCCKAKDHRPQPLLQLCWPLIFRKDRFVIDPSPIRFSSETDVTTAFVLNSCFWDCISASLLMDLSSEDKEPKQTGEEGLFFETSCI